MITVKKAERLINTVKLPNKTITVNFTDSSKRILKEDIRADRDLPPFDKSLMDGIAINAISYNKGLRAFKLSGVQAAGYPALTLTSPDNCIEIMTGAVLPKGCDCVIPIEETKRTGLTVNIDKKLKVKQWQNIRKKGADRLKSDLLLKKNKVLTPVDIAIAAAVGMARIKVSRKINIAVITSGDELIDVDKPIKPFQIRKSNSFFIKSLLDISGLCDTALFHFKDNKKAMQSGIKKILLKYDIIILTGGVSMGKFDYVPAVLEALKVKMLFHKVNQRPGKPFWFGVTSQSKPVFALPGNPVSTQIGLRRYVIPFIFKSLTGEKEKAYYVEITKNMTLPTKFEFFLPVKTTSLASGVLQAQPCTFTGSGDFSSLAGSDGFIQIPADSLKIQKGQVFRYFEWSIF